jgi:transcriptional regulator GlxA family with amidase domain
MPSATLTFVVPLDEPLLVRSPGADELRSFAGVLAGLHTRPTQIPHSGRQRGVQLALTPGGARALFGLPAAELVQQSVELDDIAGRMARFLREELHAYASWPERFAAVDRRLLGLLTHWERQPGPQPEVVEAWRLIRRGRTQVRDVARGVGWSTRHLEDRFRTEYGISPKTAVRLARFERSVALVRNLHRPLAHIAADCGYADQSHLARDWRDFAGLPPSRWRTEDPLAFVQDAEEPGPALSTA